MLDLLCSVTDNTFWENETSTTPPPRRDDNTAKLVSQILKNYDIRLRPKFAGKISLLNLLNSKLK